MNKTASGLVAYCVAQLGKPYWFGTFGQTASASLLSSKRQQYPSKYTSKDFTQQFGQRVHDCVGLVKGYMWSETATAKPVYCSNGFPDISADGLLARSKRKGDISTMPHVAGVAVFMKGHVGIYVGDCWVVEARGHAYGVVKTKLCQRKWTHWAYIEGIEYEG